MEKPPDFKSAVDDAASRNLELIRRYREAARMVQNPAVGRLMQSVLDQKASQAEILRSVAESGETGCFFGSLMARSEPAAIQGTGAEPAAALLGSVQAEEADLARFFDRLGDAAVDEENRRKLHSLSETSLKFSVWARDHLELLSLF